MDVRIRDLEADARPPSIQILLDAFRTDPWMRHCFQAERPGYEERCRAYLEEGHDWHVNGQHPWLGAASEDGLVGVLYGMGPDPPANAFPQLMARLEERCGPEACRRFVACEADAGALEPDGRYHTLALLAVEPGVQRSGFGSALVRAWAERCDADPSSEGTILSTARPENIPFYARHGYAEVGSAPLGAGNNFVLVRPRGGA